MQKNSVKNFWDQVNKTDTCWLWTGSINNTGYGTFRVEGKNWMVHRYSYFLEHRSIDPKLVIDHICGTRLCVKPNHLEQVTLQENNKRVTRQITHCPKGHEYTLENTYYDIQMKRGTRMKMSLGRQCKTCRRIRQKERS